MAEIEDIRQFWDKKVQEKGMDKSATAFDFQLKNLEVHYIVEFFKNIKKDVKVLDMGCGTGYLGAVLSKTFKNITYVGLDYGPTVIENANIRIKELGMEDRCRFVLGNAVNVDKLFKTEEFDIILTERLIINLGSKENQEECLRNTYKILKPGGYLLLFEGTVEGWQKLNEYRTKFGLKEIGNSWHQTKVVEAELIPFTKSIGLNLINKQPFGMYYFLSRVIHPFNIKPEEPKYDDKFNETALEIAKKIPDFDSMGHLRFYTFIKTIA